MESAWSKVNERISPSGKQTDTLLVKNTANRQPHSTPLQSPHTDKGKPEPGQQATMQAFQAHQKAEKHQNTKAPKQKNTKSLKHFSSYLRPASLIRLKILAAQGSKHDYDVLQEAVDFFFAHLDKEE